MENFILCAVPVTSRVKRAFEVKQETFLLVWKVLSLRPEKENSKNSSDLSFDK